MGNNYEWHERGNEYRYNHEEENTPNILNNIPSKIQQFKKLKTLLLSGSNVNKWLIRKIENLENLTALQNIYLEYNLKSKIENLNNLTSLVKLFLNCNKISKIENLETLTNLQNLNLDVNLISKIKNRKLKFPKRNLSKFQQNKLY